MDDYLTLNKLNKNNKKYTNWSVFNNWNVSEEKVSWDVFINLYSSYHKVISIKKNEYLNLIKEWDNRLEFIDKDPTHKNWDSFRPLRLSREEDWTDWLAFLIEQSSTGFFAKNIFNIHYLSQNDYLPIKVYREFTDTTNSYRADIIIQWRNEKFTHFEIKIGDNNLLKTFKASEKFQSTFKCSDDKWSNFILILPNQINNWENSVKQNNTSQIVELITWEQIVISLRKSLFSDEAIIWKVWAYSFIGVIEHKLLKLDDYWNFNKIPTSINKKIRILEKALEL